MHLPQTGCFHFLLIFSPLFSWGCNFVNQVLSILTWPLVPVLISKGSHSYSSLCQRCFSLMSLLLNWSNLYSLDLVSNHNRVLFTDLGSSFGLVIVGAVVLVRVAVDATEQVPTATVEPWKHKHMVVNTRTRSEKPHWRGAEKTLSFLSPVKQLQL